MRRSLVLSLVVLACLALLGVGAWLLLREPGRPQTAPLPGPATATPAPAAVEEAPTVVRAVTDAPTTQDGKVITSVAWPVEVDLELVLPADVLRGEGLPPLGSGRSARLRGQVTVGDRLGTPATLEFVAGMNAGRRVETNAEGYFGVRDLYPGPGLLRVSGPAIGGALREVRLLRDKETLLALSFGAPGSVGGIVFDEAGQPMPDVQVELDGQPGVTDAQGVFTYGGIPGGMDVVLVLRAPGYAPQYHTIGVLAARNVPPSQYRYTMERGGSLEVSVTRSVGAPGPARVLISTGVSEVKQPYAWHLLGPYEVQPGSSVRIDDLPPTRLSVRVEQRGARALPRQGTAVVRPNHLERLSFELEAAPALRGRVLDPAGLAVVDAAVRLEAPDRAAATMTFLATTAAAYEQNFHPTFGAAVSETRSDHQGNFVLTTWPDLVPTAYLVAQSRDGSLRGGRSVRADAGEVELRLAPAEVGRARLQIDFAGRAQGLPVVVSVDGELRPEVVLDVDQPLEIDGLAPGRWRLRARWNGELLIGGPGFEEFDLEGHERRTLDLPQGAILGQDSDTLERARG
jgi:hypothetical protein